MIAYMMAKLIMAAIYHHQNNLIYLIPIAPRRHAVGLVGFITLLQWALVLWDADRTLSSNSLSSRRHIFPMHTRPSLKTYKSGIAKSAVGRQQSLHAISNTRLLTKQWSHGRDESTVRTYTCRSSRSHYSELLVVNYLEVHDLSVLCYA